ncbi:DUF6493 family protein [Aquimarina addita]|uniref:DUF7825 domain-containing protein n=1 Tax=Aquimarina addita TaxID=870485 RepID=UPI0031E589EF
MKKKRFLVVSGASFNPKEIKKLKDIWLTAYALKNPSKSIDAIISNQKKRNWSKLPIRWEWSVRRGYSDDRKYSWAILKQSFIQKGIEEIDFSQNKYLDHILYNREFIIADTSHWFYRGGYLQEPIYLNLILNTFAYLSDIEASETKSILEAVKYSVAHLLPLNKAGYLFLTLSLFCNKTPIRAGAFDWLSLLIDTKYLDIKEFTATSTKIITNDENPIPMARIIEQFDRLLQMQSEHIDVLYQVIEASLVQINLQNLPKGFSKMLHYYYEVLQVVNNPIPKNIIAKLEAMTQINAVKKESKKIMSLYES